MPILAVGWLFLVVSYYFIFPTLVIAFFKTAFPGYFIKVVPIEAGLWETLGVMYGGWMEEFGLTAFVTVIAICALPGRLREPLWGSPRGLAALPPQPHLERAYRLLGLRLTAWFALLSLFPLVIIAIFFRSHLSQIVLAQIARHDQDMVRTIASDERISNDPARFSAVARSLSVENHTTFLLDSLGYYVSHPDSTRIQTDSRADYFPSAINQILGQRDGYIIHDASEHALVFAPLKGTSLLVVSVISTRSALESLRAFEASSLQRLSVALLALSGIAGLVIWLLVGRPLRTLTGAAQRIGQGDLTARVETRLMEDEVAQLGLAFNEMAADLASLHDGLQEEISRHMGTVEALRESEVRFRTIIEQFADGFLLFDTEGTIRECNRAQELLIGMPRSEMIGQSVWSITATRIPSRLRSKSPVEQIREKVLSMVGGSTSTGVSGPFEYPYLRPDGTEGYLQQVHFLVRFKDRNLLGGVSRDITERHRAEERIRTSLAEKELMLREIHHRVKNNLQVISSLLNLQSASIKDEHDLLLFRESENRIRSMALIHEKLYQSEDFSKIDFRQYIEGLTGYLVRSYRVADVFTDVVVDDIHLGITTAIPCGLILNELLTNALKHAFPDGRKGQIRIELRNVEGKRVRLTVRDNGVGLPAGFDPEHAQSLGMHLTRILASQLDGTLHYTVNAGTAFDVEFPMNEDPT
jgi:PAS domain S-box-containing protein